MIFRSCCEWRKEDKILAITTYQKNHNMDGPLQIMLESKVVTWMAHYK
jgi:hypothetical protein